MTTTRGSRPLTLAATLLVLTALVAATLLSGGRGGPARATAATPTLPTEGLHILLTNDDGWSAPGINAVRDALRAAGHTVTTVARRRTRAASAPGSTSPAPCGPPTRSPVRTTSGR